ncbi:MULTISPECIES: serine/threonine-protein kinase [Streptomyces]|uniref:serine/threonine-protein kinase n=1 Tax=Streptomyces TaxID=1883 RepID=UPI001E337B57|nr:MULTISPECIES: serine/threonine-protein kinase [Streptomyces]UFQ17348.1 serine/threonine protein kinase [Streptomyces huasconensis]WCL86953.1 serine/threonine-protein kinase [Streptomyces sp. JCM 35825]
MRPLEAGEPTVIGPYRLLGRLGSGGMGRVYLGRSGGGRTVAVKIVHPHFALDEEFRARFRREVEAARRVGGAWTAPVLDADPDAPVPWVATGYAAGPSLTEAVREGAPLPAHSVRVLGAGLAEALAHVHGLGLVHRDVKPSNVLLTLDGPRLIDFGIARATDGTASLTATGASVGSPGYMAPEQILGKAVTGAADVFSLGAVLVYAATGQPPFPGDSSAALLYKVVHEEPELGALDGDVRELAAACLAKDPAARPAPGDLARRLAPGGAAPLVAAGWLPGPVVERVSRGAVRLLDLDTGAGEAPSGPVAFDSPSGQGAFGPPDPSYALPPAPADEATAAPGRLSVSVAATSVPEGPDGRGRRVSCTVALAVAGALAAVTVGTVFVLGALRNDDDAMSGGDGAAQPPAATDAGRVPEAYLGRWSGKAAANGGTIPLGTFEVTLRQAKPGQRVGTVVQHDLIGNTCTDVLTLKSATKEVLVATGKGAGTNGGQCAQTSHTVRLRPDGRALGYTSDDPDAGDPRARLTRRE